MSSVRTLIINKEVTDVTSSLSLSVTFMHCDLCNPVILKIQQKTHTETHRPHILCTYMETHDSMKKMYTDTDCDTCSWCTHTFVCTSTHSPSD